MVKIVSLYFLLIKVVVLYNYKIFEKTTAISPLTGVIIACFLIYYKLYKPLMANIFEDYPAITSELPDAVSPHEAASPARTTPIPPAITVPLPPTIVGPACGPVP
jgi:hypothetical protein